MCKGGGARDQKAKYITSNFAEELQVKGIRLHAPRVREPCGRTVHGGWPSILAVPGIPARGELGSLLPGEACLRGLGVHAAGPRASLPGLRLLWHRGPLGLPEVAVNRERIHTDGHGFGWDQVELFPVRAVFVQFVDHFLGDALRPRASQFVDFLRVGVVAVKRPELAAGITKQDDVVVGITLLQFLHQGSKEETGGLQRGSDSPRLRRSTVRWPASPRGSLKPVTAPFLPDSTIIHSEEHWTPPRRFFYLSSRNARKTMLSR